MTTAPAIRYARSGDVHIAFQHDGSGPLDLLFFPDGLIPVESMLEQPSLARFLERLGTFARVIRFDRRGMGLSDPVTRSDPPTLEQWTQDADAVLDAIDSKRAALLAMAEGAFVACLLAATRPDRVSALVLINATPGFTLKEFASHPSARVVEELSDEVRSTEWGSTTHLAEFAPSAVGDERYRAWLERAVRRALSPAMAQTLFDVMFRSDIRAVLPAVRVPTLVIHRRGNRYVTPEHGRYLADHIPGARYVEVEGVDHVPYVGDARLILDEVEVFLTGAKLARVADRVLATLMFSDIVGSTEKATALGDAAWRDLLMDYQKQVRQEVERFGGREVDWAGDGIFATFDGPARAVRAACAIRVTARRLGLEARAGVHTGECEVMAPKLGGIAVVIGARIAAAAATGEVLASSTVRDLVAGSGLRFDDRGMHQLKGVPDEWRLFAVDQVSAIS
jgi:class 3 adenylate cyclase